MGLRVPDDVSVVGAATPDLASSVYPSLAAIDLCGADIGRTAMEMLITQLSDKRSPLEHRVIPSCWIDGDSIADISKRSTEGAHVVG
jgi:DNA-binding LacI/PurR family transcriptional regulator